MYGADLASARNQKKEEEMKRQDGFEVNLKKKGGETMKKALLLTAVALLFAGTAMASQIKNSKHNLGDTGTGAYASTTVGSEICIFCHAPHNPAKNIPLWNRTDPTTTSFTFYNSTTINMVQAATGVFSTNSISKFCMSCHDGASGLWANVSNKFGKTYAMPGSGIMGGSAAIGKSGNLANDHPVNIEYRTSGATGDADFNDVGTATGKGVKFLYDASAAGGASQPLVECTSCHDPHKTTYGKFLRRTNDSSGLCLACHNK